MEIGKIWVCYCYKSVQRFRVTCLFTGQYDTREYGTIAGVIIYHTYISCLAKGQASSISVFLIRELLN